LIDVKKIYYISSRKNRKWITNLENNNINATNKMEQFNNNSKTCLNCEDDNAIQLNNFTKQILVFYPWFMVIILIIFGN